mgnify:CR=1 FL=1|tara:strand:+ start:1727 stop:2479 length:753 start_codon:yes stop_codon:yes gene_type:complete
MAISSSGSVSFSQIQSEFGGSNPISLSEYYSGGLPNNFNNTGTSTAFAPTVKSTTTTYSYTSGKATLTATRYYDGFCNTALNSYMTNTTQSMVINKFTGVDKTGNAGAIPSSGAIQANHFRGTSSGTNTPLTCYGMVSQYDSGGGFFPATFQMWFAGHVGTAYSYGTTYSGSIGLPLTSIYCAAEGNFPATTFYNGTQSSSGASLGMMGVTHTTNPTLGNVTLVLFTLYSQQGTAHSGGFSGTWSITVTH